MVIHPNLTPELALAEHQERLDAAERRRRATRTTQVEEAMTTRPGRNGPRWNGKLARQFGGRRDLATWLVRAGDVVARYPATELDGDRRPALATVVGALHDAAREGGVDVPIRVGAGDPAVVLVRMVGTLATSTAGRSVPVSRRRSRLLRAALDAFESAPVEQPGQLATEVAA